jgi:hypothetical protein
MIPTLPTIVGHNGFRDWRFFGHEILADLLGNAGLPDTAWLAMTGKLPTPEQAQVLGDCAVVAAAADPHIWPFKLARLAASYGLPAQGIAAAFAASPGSEFKPERFGRAAELLETLLARAPDDDVGLRDALVELLREGQEPFGVVYRKRDERLEGLGRVVRARGREKLPYWHLAERTFAIARTELQLEPHFTFGIAAYALDAGMRARDVRLLGLLVFFPSVLANAGEAADQSAEVLRRLPASFVRYAGPAPRRSARAAKGGR